MAPASREYREENQMSFYTFNQNNSGGGFDRDEDVSHYVIIEADSAFAANTKAESVGIYFNGCDDGTDCSCCGDRWCEVWGKGDEAPLIYDKAPEDIKDMFCRPGDTYCIIYYADGRKTALTKATEGETK
jgi:hypothetical protein